MRTFPDSLIRDIVRGEPLVRLALRDWQHPFQSLYSNSTVAFSVYEKVQNAEACHAERTKEGRYAALDCPNPSRFRRGDGASLCAERPDEPTRAGASRSTRLAGQALGQRNANDSCHFYSRPQRSL